MADMIKDDEDFKDARLEEERIAQLEDMLDDEDLSDSDESSAGQSFSSRPMSGKEARQARSARIRAALAGKQPLEADRYLCDIPQSIINKSKWKVLSMSYDLLP